VDHIRTDHREIRFIEVAFRGDLALSPKDVQKYLHGRIQRPPGTQADLVAKARTWVDLVGKGYTASPECGCVMPGIKLEVHHTQLTEVTSGPPSREFSEAKFELRLPPVVDDQPTAFAAETSLTRQIQLTLPRPCIGTASREETWDLKATVDEETGAVRVRRSVAAEEPVGKVECRYPQGTAEMELFPSNEGMLSYGELVFPPDSAASRTLTYEMEGYKETLTIKVLEVPGK
jgi:hypothetical protein